MAGRQSLYLASLLLASFCIAATAQYSGNQTLDSFDDVTINFPLKGDIQVSSDGTYSFQWTASQDLTNVLRVYEDDMNDLFLEIYNNATIDLNSVTASYVLSMPEGTLTGLTLNGAGAANVSGDVIYYDDDNNNDNDDNDDDDEDEDDDDADLEVTLRGAGTIYLYNVSDSNLDIENDGAGNIVVTGSPNEIDYDAAGAGSLYAYGVTGEVDVDLKGAGNVYLEAANDITIDGSSTGVGQVTYNRGSCKVQNPNPVFNPCVQSSNVAQPPSMDVSVTGK